MNAAKIANAITALTVARNFIWANVPPGTEGKVRIDNDLFSVMLTLRNELALIGIKVVLDSEKTEEKSC